MAWIAPITNAIIAPMLGSFRQTLIVSMALLFAASGFVARYCMAAHFITGHTIVSQSVVTDAVHHAHASDHGEHAQHSHDESHHQQAPSDSGDVACAKCCGSCTLTTAVLPAVANEPIFIVSPAMFVGKSDHCSDTTVKVDPGIPKRIA